MRKPSRRIILYLVALVGLVIASGYAIFGIVGRETNLQFAARYWVRVAATQPGPTYVDPDDSAYVYTIDRPIPGLVIVRGLHTGTIWVLEPLAKAAVLMLGASIGIGFALPCILLETKTARARARLSEGKCIECGYDLRASGDTCPECGATAK